MSFKHLSLSKGFSSIKSYEIDKPITLLILLGILVILIVTLLGQAVLELENDDFPLIKSSPIVHIREFLCDKTLLSGFQVGFFALILLFEWLRGHIGEKRFAERSIEAGFAFFIYFVFVATAHFGPSFVFIASEGY